MASRAQGRGRAKCSDVVIVQTWHHLFVQTHRAHSISYPSLDCRLWVKMKCQCEVTDHHGCVALGWDTEGAWAVLCVGGGGGTGVGLFVGSLSLLLDFTVNP